MYAPLDRSWSMVSSLGSSPLQRMRHIEAYGRHMSIKRLVVDAQLDVSAISFALGSNTGT